MQVIEKVKVVPEGYNGAGMNYDGGNRRDVNGKANAGLTLGIIGTALGAWALFGNRRSAGASVYVAINAQYHDYAKLFEEWFGGNIDNKVFESAITFWFKDVDFDGDKVWEYFHMNN